MSFLEGVEKSIRLDERLKMEEEGYIHKSKCPRAREDTKLKQLKKENKSLQRKVTELMLQIESYKMMR